MFAERDLLHRFEQEFRIQRLKLGLTMADDDVVVRRWFERTDRRFSRERAGVLIVRLNVVRVCIRVLDREREQMRRWMRERRFTSTSGWVE